MATEQNLETMQEEIKLLKGELKQSLASVRDYLLNMELPSSEFSTILAALGGDGEQKVTMKGSFTAPPAGAPPTEPQDEFTEVEEEESIEDESDMPSEDEDLLDTGNSLDDRDELSRDNNNRIKDEDDQAEDRNNLAEDDDSLAEDDDSQIPEDTLPPQDIAGEDDSGDLNEALDSEYENPSPESEMEERPMDYDNTTAETYPGIPKVNMLANLICWIARVKKEIGHDQIPTFLELYGLSGHLSPELKEVIIHLSEITEARSDAGNIAEIWSREMLSLHGIMAGGDAPLHPMIPTWSDGEIQPVEEEIIDVDKSREKPVKLKLVLPNGEGKSQEFCVNLSPEEDSDIPSSQPSS